MLLRIGEQTAYRFDQLQGLLARHPDSHSHDPAFLSETRTAALLKRWEALDLANYRKIRYDEPGWIWLTRKGLYHLDLPMRFLDPRHASLDHLFWINEARVLVEEAYGSREKFQWESERQFRVLHEHFKAERKREPELWVPREYRSSHRPDALFRYRRSQEPDAPEWVCAVEVELSEKKYEGWNHILTELRSHYDYTYYYVHPDVKASFCKAADRFNAEEAQFGRKNRYQWLFLHDLEQ
jgi:hypothetical protein